LLLVQRHDEEVREIGLERDHVRLPVKGTVSSIR
jgi:hypothetical protein